VVRTDFVVVIGLGDDEALHKSVTNSSFVLSSLTTDRDCGIAL
jgi:hypothetical protein